MTRIVGNIHWAYPIEHEDNLSMAKLFQAKQSFCIELVRIQFKPYEALLGCSRKPACDGDNVSMMPKLQVGSAYSRSMLRDQ